MNPTTKSVPSSLNMYRARHMPALCRILRPVSSTWTSTGTAQPPLGSRNIRLHSSPPSLIPHSNINMSAADVSETSPAQQRDALVWIDCEMTGLNPDTDSVIEIYCLITDGQLELLDESGWGTVVYQSKERMAMMDEWCTRVHGESGLTTAVINSTVTPQQAADGLLAYIQKHIPEKGTALLAGNSVHADRAFLRLGPYKKVLDHLHYRILDVSSVKEAARRWCPEVASAAPPKRGLHEAKQDILESIEEAKYYKTAIFQAPRV